MAALLNNIFLCLTFHWDVRKLTVLQLVVQGFAEWPTNVDVKVITNCPKRLEATSTAWRVPDSFQALGPPGDLSHPHEPAWVHRDVMKAAHCSGNYSTYIYIEDDMQLSWDALVSWAQDQAKLEPLGFQRQFYRTEIAPWDGELWLTDALQNINLPKYERKLNIGPQKNAHQHYLQLPEPYSAVYVATRSLMERFVHSPYWSKREGPWPTREMASNGIMFIAPPEGFWVEALVPYSDLCSFNYSSLPKLHCHTCPTGNAAEGHMNRDSTMCLRQPSLTTGSSASSSWNPFSPPTENISSSNSGIDPR